MDYSMNEADLMEDIEHHARELHIMVRNLQVVPTDPDLRSVVAEHAYWINRLATELLGDLDPFR